jgi:shikimate 5-dehydrogenase
VAALAHYGADVTIYNRTVDRARRLGSEFSCRFAGLEAAPSTAAEIVINCTPIGMHPHVDASPLERIPRGVKVVFDTIYNPPRTRLLHQASQAGCLCVSGLEMFVNQGCAQFELWTHRPAPREVMRQALMDSIR